MTMRKLIVCNLISVDGFYSGPGDNVMAMPFDTTFSDYNAERLRAADTLLLGRRSFEGFRDYWPAIADDPDQPAVEREISRLNNAIAKVVVSDTLTDADLGPWADTTVVSRSDAHEAIDELKRGPGREILVFGSHVLWNDLLSGGLVDEVHLMIGSAFLGDGVPVFGGRRTDLRLLDVRRLGESQLILARYAAG
ncbi:MAG TPA: dihydrofolate reductase family protein [Candidatus Limnocylindria bacterium]|nr:dihydrofolate reductase family protein [Candidatus Limnocylindria bacterium]